MAMRPAVKGLVQGGATYAPPGGWEFVGTATFGAGATGLLVGSAQVGIALVYAPVCIGPGAIASVSGSGGSVITLSGFEFTTSIDDTVNVQLSGAGTYTVPTGKYVVLHGYVGGGGSEFAIDGLQAISPLVAGAGQVISLLGGAGIGGLTGFAYDQ